MKILDYLTSVQFYVLHIYILLHDMIEHSLGSEAA